MSVRARVDRLRRAVGGLPPPGRLELVVAVPVGSGMADDLPPGVHVNADGRVATVVFAGAEPDPAVLAGLEARLAPWGRTIRSQPDPPAGAPEHPIPPGRSPRPTGDDGPA